jgi:hypothetical protein
MRLREFLGLRSGINNIPFLLLYEVLCSLVGYRRFERKKGSHFQNVKMSNSIPLVEDTTTIFHRKIPETITSDEVV